MGFMQKNSFAGMYGGGAGKTVKKINRQKEKGN